MLFQQINNEALDEDRQADLEVVRRLKKNYTENKEAVRPRRRLDPVQKNAFLKELGLFEKYVYKTEAFLETVMQFGTPVDPRESSKLLGDIVVTYNNLVAFLGKIGYGDMDAADKTFIKNKINGNIEPIKRIIVQLNERAPDFVLLPISNILSDMELSNYRIQSFTDDPQLETMRKQNRIANLIQEQEDAARPVQDDDELFGFDRTALRRAMEDYARVNPGERLDTQRAFDDISSAFARRPTAEEYMDVLARIRPRNQQARRARQAARAQQDIDDEAEMLEDEED